MSKLSIESQSTMTDRYQTTVPTPVRKALNLTKRDKIKYTILGDGNVVISKVENHNDDPVLDKFLSFLESDMANRPEHLVSLSEDLQKQALTLTDGIPVDLDSALHEEDD